MLNNFFRINLPYGIARNAKGEWMAFNREYRPIGFNDSSEKGNPGSSYLKLNVYSNYGVISEQILLDLAEIESAIQRNDTGEIIKVFFYDDGTNPVNQSNDTLKLWEAYFSKLKRLSKIKIKSQ